MKSAVPEADVGEAGEEFDAAEMWFDPALRAADDAKHLQAVVNVVVDRYFEHTQIKRRRGEPPRAIEVLVVNVMYAAISGAKGVLFRADPGSAWYKQTNPLRAPPIESDLLPQVCKVLERLGYIKRLRTGSKQERTVSLIAIGPALSVLQAKVLLLVAWWLGYRSGQFVWGQDSFKREPAHIRRVVILRKGDRRKEQPGGRVVEFRAATQTFDGRTAKDLVDQVVRYNDALSKAAIRLRHRRTGEAPDVLEQWNAANNRYVYRSFNHGRLGFDSNGRFYGAFWINMPKAEAWRIALDDESVVELDFSAMFLSTIYAWEWQHLANDAYHIPAAVSAFEKMGYAPEQATAKAREAVKKLINARLFDEGGRWNYPKLSASDPHDLWPDVSMLPAHKLLALIDTKHPVINRQREAWMAKSKARYGNKPGIALGHHLFTVESNLMAEVIDRCLDAGIVPLIKHDALMVKRSKHKAAAKIMAEVFQSRLRTSPKIKAKLMAEPEYLAALSVMGLPCTPEVFEAEYSFNGKAMAWVKGFGVHVLDRLRLTPKERELRDALLVAVVDAERGRLRANPESALYRLAHRIVETVALVDGVQVTIRRRPALERCAAAVIEHAGPKLVQALAVEMKEIGYLDTRWVNLAKRSAKEVSMRRRSVGMY